MNRSIADSIKFWETRRIHYNLLLTLVFTGWVAVHWPLFKGAFTAVHVAQLAVLALIANVLYCVAYIAEALLHGMAVTAWQRWRWTIWLLGTLFAILLESYWINDEIAPFIR